MYWSRIWDSLVNTMNLRIVVSLKVVSLKEAHCFNTELVTLSSIEYIASWQIVNCKEKVGKWSLGWQQEISLARSSDNRSQKVFCKEFRQFFSKSLVCGDWHWETDVGADLFEQTHNGRAQFWSLYNALHPCIWVRCLNLYQMCVS